MLRKLPPREREIVDLLYERGDLTVAEISEALPRQPTGSAVRTMLSRLERKGFVRRTDSSKGYLYRPAVSDNQARQCALKELVRVFFHGSRACAATALLGMSERLNESELDELEALIARVRAAKSKGECDNAAIGRVPTTTVTTLDETNLLGFAKWCASFQLASESDQ